MLSALRRIQSRSQSTALRFAAHAPSTSQQTSLLSTGDLALPIPEPLTSQLVALGIDELSARRISSVMEQAVLCLKTNCEDDLERRRHVLQAQSGYFHESKSRSLILATYHVIYNQAVNHYITYLLKDFTPRVLKARALLTEAEVPLLEDRKTRRRRFNQNAIPLLEQIFDKNAFPSRVEKYELAMKCDMAYRQIHVWFQNRRSRFRKEGKELRKRASVFREALEKSVENVLFPADPSEDGDLLWTEDELVDHDSAAPDHSFISDAPPHAFPSAYPPVCEYDPFPDTCTFETPWLQKPARVAIENGPPVDISSLTTLLSQMSIVDETPSTTQSHASSRIGFVTHCAHAPLTALIRRTYRSPRVHRCLERNPSLTQANLTCGQNVRARGPCVPSAMIKREPVVTTSKCLSRPKTGLPHRAPKNLLLHHSASSSASLPIKSSVSSRVWSTRSTSSEFASSASDSESPLPTPPFLPIDLPTFPRIFETDDSWDPTQSSSSFPHYPFPLLDLLGSEFSNSPLTKNESSVSPSLPPMHSELD